MCTTQIQACMMTLFCRCALKKVVPHACTKAVGARKNTPNLENRHHRARASGTPEASRVKDTPYTGRGQPRAA